MEVRRIFGGPFACSVLVMLMIGSTAFIPLRAEGTEVVRVIATPLADSEHAHPGMASQQVSGEMLREQVALDLTEYMQRNFSGVFVNEAAGNPLQPDVQYRGYVGSPLLGLPQGLAVYQDGVRVNEPFGDTVTWAILPRTALASGALHAGASPLYGLNALGGAVSVLTRSGRGHPGVGLEALAGSYGRLSLQGDVGGEHRSGLHGYLSGDYFEEDGWRDDSPTEVTSGFARVGGTLGEHTEWDASLTLGSTDLVGNGASPTELLELDRTQIFTYPDRTENDLVLVNLAVAHDLAGDWRFSGNTYVRDSDIATLNGDDSDYEACEDDPQYLCVDDGDEPLFDTDGLIIPASPDLIGATINRTRTDQRSQGITAQATWQPGESAQFLVLGIAWDDADVAFSSGTELGRLNDSRAAIGGGVKVGDAATDLHTRTRTGSVYAGYSLSLNDRTSLELTGRYNDVRIELNDHLGTALNGRHRYQRFNPSIGISVAASDAVTLWGRYSEANRTPSPMELTCADEDAPCRLPNAFLADPPLEDVVSRTLEAGIRGVRESFLWQAGVFRMINEDDIHFISAGSLTSEGYFDNIGRTRRTGIELALSGTSGPLSWFANYGWLDAEFRETLSIPSPNNPSAIDGEVFVHPGDRIPLLPIHLFKAGLDLSLTPRLKIAAQLVAASGFNLRGDEGNDEAKAGAHTVVNLRVGYAIDEQLELFLKIDNLFDERYETFGTFGEADEVLGDDFENPRFLTPAAPRGGWVGIRARW